MRWFVSTGDLSEVVEAPDREKALLAAITQHCEDSGEDHVDVGRLAIVMQTTDDDIHYVVVPEKSDNW